MSEEVVLLVADDKFLPHAKALMVNCRREGGWQGDFALLVPEGTDTREVEGRGIDIFRVPATGFLTKFHIFNEYYRKWSVVLYMDCDVIVMSHLQPLFDQLWDWEPLEDVGKPVIADLEDGPAWMAFEHQAHGTPPQRKRNFELQKVFVELTREYPCTLEQFWNTSILLFDPFSIPRDTPAICERVQKKYGVLNDQEKGGTDQQIIHLVLYDRLRKVKQKLFCYWGLDEMNARVPSAGRGWVGGEVPIVLHYARWHAPWIEKVPEAHAYRNLRLDKVCHEFYAQNLQDFDKEFCRA